ncbi:MAG: RelA/SpoT family protein [Bacteroidales bacterium]|nr:RelA/SpoT family protein [Bacteroidales bacterium]
MTPQEQRDEEMIQAAFDRLSQTYMSSNHRGKIDIITKAFNFAKAAHKGVRRRSGEPYILHPLAVAQVCCEEIGLGSTTICAALLHDVVEDTEYTRDDIANLFGAKVANIVDGVTKVGGGIFADRESTQAETFKKILLTMSDDIRVILVKIADRLHNMRTLQSMPQRKQMKIVGETLFIYAPLCERLGLNRIKTELENLSFKYEHPDDYQMVVQNLRDSQMERDDLINDFTPPIREALDAMGIDYTIKARIKSPFSIWQKMMRKKVPFSEVFDILAIRIIFHPKDRKHEIEESYAIYAALTKIYKPHPIRFREWLTTPKANGYQALHNTFMSNQGNWIEVQIRSDRMDDIAEQGFAAHWKYKEDGSAYDEHELDSWVNSIKQILDDPQPDTLDLLDTIKLNLFVSEISVFSPKGDIYTLPSGASVLDFAFAIHSFVGTHCMSAKVNHKLVPLSHRLQSGDQVEIITGRDNNVQGDWLTYVTTAKAKGKISAHLRRQDRELQNEGEQHVRQFLEAHDFEANTSHINKLYAFHHFTRPDELYLAVGKANISLGDADVAHLSGKKVKKRSRGWRRFVPFMKPSSTDARRLEGNVEEFVKNLDRKQTLLLDEETLSKCIVCPECSPIPGDEALGYINPEGQLEIHRRECPVALRHKANFGDQIIAVDWAMHRQETYDTAIYIEGRDAEGVLLSIAGVLTTFQQFQLRSINLQSKDGIFKGDMVISLFDIHDIALVCKQLLQIDQVTKAVRKD